MPNEIRHLIVLSIDGLGASWLGPYGNTVGETPAWNQLAAESLLFEHCYARGPQLKVACEALWRPVGAGGERRTVLITDSEEAAELDAAERFDERLFFPPREAAAASSVEATQTAELLAAASQWLADTEQPSALWVQASGFYGAWDAPYPLRQAVADEDDPDPPRFVEPPQQTLAEDYDPDEMLAYMHAYVGQVAAIDWALQAFLDDLAQSGKLAESLLVATATRGYALGEHRDVGGEQALHAELLHVPCLLRFPDQSFAALRSQRILPAGDLDKLLAACDGRLESQTAPPSAFGLNEPLEDAFAVAFSVCDDRTALRTPAWFLTPGGDPAWRLFAKPDDRWEVNEVSSLCEDAVEEMLALMESQRLAEQEGRPFAGELSDLIRRGYDG